MRAVLEAEGYIVLTAEDGEEALEKMESCSIDLAVVDIMMPKMDGYEFTRTLRLVENEQIGRASGRERVDVLV